MCFTVHVANMYKDKLILTYFLLINPTVLWRIAGHSAVCLQSEIVSICWFPTSHIQQLPCKSHILKTDWILIISHIMCCRHPPKQVYEHNFKEQAKGKGISENIVNTLFILNWGLSGSTQGHWMGTLKNTNLAPVLCRLWSKYSEKDTNSVVHCQGSWQAIHAAGGNECFLGLGCFRLQKCLWREAYNQN